MQPHPNQSENRKSPQKVAKTAQMAPKSHFRPLSPGALQYLRSCGLSFPNVLVVTNFKVCYERYILKNLNFFNYTDWHEQFL